jgi:hypothetical protein
MRIHRVHPVGDEIQAPLACVEVNSLPEPQLEFRDALPNDFHAVWVLAQVAKPIKTFSVCEVFGLFEDRPDAVNPRIAHSNLLELFHELVSHGCADLGPRAPDLSKLEVTLLLSGRLHDWGWCG